MPIYAFACTACGHHFDRLQKLSDPDPSACPVCAVAAVKRQVTAPSFRLSGSGWYETDFKKDSDKKRNLSEARGTSSEAKSEATTAAKTADAGTKVEKASATPAKAAPAPAAKPAAGTS